MASAETAARQGLARIFEAESAGVFGFLEYRSGNRAVAEDLTAQTFEAALKRFEAGRGEEVTPAWLHTVARRRLVDHWRSLGAQRRRHLRLIQEYRDVAPPPNDPDSDVDDALSSLSPRQRAALILRYVDDLSVAEVAETLGLSYKATESLLSRARRSFAQAYGHRHPGTVSAAWSNQ